MISWRKKPVVMKRQSGRVSGRGRFSLQASNRDLSVNNLSLELRMESLEKSPRVAVHSSNSTTRRMLRTIIDQISYARLGLRTQREKVKGRRREVPKQVSESCRFTPETMSSIVFDTNQGLKS